MLASEPVSRLSTQIARCPLASSAWQRCEPRKPAPPVTTEVGIAVSYPARRPARQMLTEPERRRGPDGLRRGSAVASAT